MVDGFFDREGKHIANTTAGTVAALNALKVDVVKVIRKGDDTKLIESIVNAHPRVVALKNREKQRRAAGTVVVAERTKSSVSAHLPNRASTATPVRTPTAASAGTASIEEHSHAAFLAAFLSGDVEKLRKYGDLEEVVTTSGEPMDRQSLDQEFFGVESTQSDVEKLMESYGNVKFVAIDEIYELRRGDVVDFSGLVLENGMKALHFRIVKINSGKSSDTEHILQCLVDSYYQFGKVFKIIRGATMEIKIPKPKKYFGGLVARKSDEPMLQENQSIKAWNITYGKNPKTGEVVEVNRALFLASNIVSMRVFCNDEGAFDSGLLHSARMHRKGAKPH